MNGALDTVATQGLSSGGSVVLRCRGMTLLFTRGVVLYTMQLWTGPSIEWPGMVGALGTGIAYHDWMRKREALQRFRNVLDMWERTGEPIEYKVG